MGLGGRGCRRLASRPCPLSGGVGQSGVSPARVRGCSPIRVGKANQGPIRGGLQKVGQPAPSPHQAGLQVLEGIIATGRSGRSSILVAGFLYI